MSGSASRRQHKQFCDIEGWGEVKNARDKTVRHHITYERPLADGRVLRTRISRPTNNDTYGASLWAAILREQQLCVSEDEFWDCVGRSIKPSRPGAAGAIPSQALPASLVYQLLHTLGMSEEQLASLSQDDAVALMAQHWSKPPE